MKFKADDGSEWKQNDQGSFCLGDDCIVIRRIPDKSELEKWVDIRTANLAEDDKIRIIYGFKHAIEVLEDAHRKTMNKPYAGAIEALSDCKLWDFIDYLKRYAGVK